MAKLIAHGTELFRYFNPATGRLFAVMSDGVRLYRTAYSGWKVFARKKPGALMGNWVAAMEAKRAQVPEWAQRTTSLPSSATLQKWEMDGICKTPTGHTVEPDGTGPDGVPSWLRVLRLI